MVKDTLKYTRNVEDAEKKLIIFKIRDVQVVDSQMQKSENTIGRKKSFKEEARELVE